MMKKLIPAISATLNKTLLAGVVAVSPLLVSQVINTVAPDTVNFSAVQAQVTAKNKFANEQRKHPNVTETFGKRITEAANFLQPSDPNAKPDPNRALQILNGLEANKAKYNAYEMVLLYQYYGYTYLSLENYPRAISNFELVVKQSPNLPVATEAQTLLMLGQLYSGQDNPRKALDTLLRWTNYVDELRPEQYYMFATLYYQLDDNNNALLNINEAVRKQEATGKVPAESWYILQRGLYFDKEDYKNGLVALEKLITHYSKAQYWKQLSQVYRVMDRNKDSLSALETCYLMGGLTTERDLVNLAYAFFEAEVPYKAAKVLNKAIYTDKAVEPSAKNLKLLADAHRLAQNAKASLAEYQKAAEKSKDGELIIGLSQAYLANGEFAQASKWGKAALRAGGLKRPDQANLTVAQAEFELKNFDEAIKFFNEAAKDSRSEKAGRQWAAYAAAEKQKYELAQAD